MTKSDFAVSVGSSVILFLLFEFVALNLYDVSWDGQAYHLEAILKMSEGWNPIKATLDNSAKPDNIFINHYPRGSWYASFSLYALTGKIEGVKVFNFLWFIIIWFSCSALLNRFLKFNFLLSLFIGLLTAANPVFILQSASNYLDGQVAMALTLVIIFSALSFYSGNFLYALLLTITISIAVNLKFTVPFYVFILIVGSCAVFIYHKNFIAVRKIISVTVVGFVLGIGVLGFSPYISNTLQFGNPIYPIAEKSQEKLNSAIENSLAPVSFQNMNRVQRLYQSTFSKGIWSRAPHDNVLKIPGTFSEDELLNYVRPDPDMAGMGPFFSFVLLVCFVGLFFLFIGNKKIFFTIIIALIAILISVFLSSVGWLSRYAPQFYLIAIVISIGLLAVQTRVTKTIAVLCLAVLLVNDFMVANFYYTRQNLYTKSLEKKLDELAQRKSLVHVYFGRFESNRVRFKEKKINFQEVKSISEIDSATMHFLPRLFDEVATD